MSLSVREYLDTLHNLDIEYKQNVEALKRSWSLYNKGMPLPKSINGHADAVKEVRSWRRSLDEVIARTQRQFTIKDVRDALQQQGIETDLSAVSTYLKKLADDGTLTVIEPGRGRRPTVYESA